ncbi:MAG: UDP-N-acetylmuramate dehydrogenase [Dehalococcoidia bacterium]
MLDAAFIHALQAIGAPVKLDEPLSRHTTIGIGGPADAYVTVEDASQLSKVVQLAGQAGVPFFVLGSGSNIVVGDRGIRGVVIDNKARAQSDPERRMNGEERFVIRAESGANFAATARHLAFAGYAGMEWACGIPGTLGGAVVYNAGAYGGCLGDVLQRIAVATADGDMELAAADLGLVYRGSDFTRGLMTGRAVLWAEFALWRGDETALRAQVADYDERRTKAQPPGRNAGSFFKNPPGHPAWKLLDATGMRGYQIGGAQFSPKHCNFLINAGGATAADVAALKSLAQQRIFEEFGVHMENEVSLVGEGFGDD